MPDPIVFAVRFSAAQNRLILVLDGRTTDFSYASRGQRVEWVVSVGEIEYIAGFELKPDAPNNVNIFAQNPQRAIGTGPGDPRKRWAGIVNDRPPDPDLSVYFYNILWKRRNVVELQRLDPIIAIRPSTHSLFNYVFGALGLMGAGVLGILATIIFRRMKNLKERNNIKLLEEKKAEIEVQINKLK